MATQVNVVTKTFEKDNGELIPYKQLVINGSINGEYYEVVFKGDKNQMTLAKMLLDSKEDLKTVQTVATDEDNDFFKDMNSKSDKIDLNSED